MLQHRDHYQLEALRQLNDRDFYKPLSAPIYLQTAALIKRTVNNMRHQGFINKRQQHFLSPPSNPRPRHFYTLPKIHKSTDKWTVPGVIPPGRLIVSGRNSESTNVEHFIDYHLQSIATSIPSFIPHSLHFKSLFSNLDIRDSNILFSLDVESLYTNIPIQQGIASVKQALSEHASTPKNRPDKFILTLLELTLLRNDFNLTMKHTYKPKAPLWAKNTHPPLLTFSCITGNNKPFRLLITLLCFGNVTSMTFSASGDTLKINYTLLFNTSISSTATLKLALLTIYIPLIFWSTTSLKITPNFQQKIFFKPTDTHKLLHPKSYHPTHVFKGIVKAHLLRYIQLSSHFDDFMQSYRILKSNLLNYGYTRLFIRICKQLALSLTNCQRNRLPTLSL